MRIADFETMVQGMAAELPTEYLDGIAEIVVSRATLPHPVRADVYTLGECIPLPATADDVDSIQSRVVLYHGSFQALGGTDPEFDWREEAVGDADSRGSPSSGVAGPDSGPGSARRSRRSELCPPGR
jgi:hypothetical protein